MGDNEVTAKLLGEFSQQLPRKQPATAAKSTRPSRMSLDGCERFMQGPQAVAERDADEQAHGDLTSSNLTLCMRKAMGMECT